jgi:hypothetical protein
VLQGVGQREVHRAGVAADARWAGAALSPPHEGWGVVCGRRFECVSNVDALGPGFFPKLQVALPRQHRCTGVRYSQGALWVLIGQSEVLFRVSPTLTGKECLCVCVCVCVCVARGVDVPPFVLQALRSTSAQVGRGRGLAADEGRP